MSSKTSIALRGSVTVIIIIGAIIGARMLILTKPKAERKPKSEPVVTVLVDELKKGDYPISFYVSGTVTPARRVSLLPQVSGLVTEESAAFIPGGYLEKGTVVVRIDPRDYTYTLSARQADLAKAQLAYESERGMQQVAKHEWNQLKQGEINDLEKSLVLREPHLASSRSALNAAQAGVDKAKLDLERTAITAPFNALVVTKNISTGAFVSPATVVGDIIGTDEFWIRFTMPAAQLPLLTVPSTGETGAKVIITPTTSGTDASWQGTVLSRNPEIEATGRLAQLLAVVKNPLVPVNGHTLLLGQYVHVQIQGNPLENVFRIPRSALHNNDELWIVKDDDRLEIRTVNPILREKDYIYVRDGLRNGDLLVVSSVPGPVDGMKLRIEPAQNPLVGDPM